MAAQRGDAGSGGGGTRGGNGGGRWGRAEQAGSLVGSEMGSLVGFHFFNFLKMIYRAGQYNRLGKSVIYNDLWTEAVMMPASVNRKHPPPVIFL